MKNFFRRPSNIFFCIVMLFSAQTWAHSGDSLHDGLLHGFFHPLSGLDHVLAMLAVGLLAASTVGRLVWILPLTFVVVMGLGGLLGVLTLPSVLAEHGIILSLLVLGGLIYRGGYLPQWVGIVLIVLFALCHGYAHGSEMPQRVSIISYAIGFMLATSLLHLCGIGMALLLRKFSGLWLRMSGVLIALYGGVLLLG